MYPSHLFAKDLTPEDINSLRHLVAEAARVGAYELIWGDKRLLTEELQGFFWYYDNRPALQGQMACECLVIEKGDAFLLGETWENAKGIRFEVLSRLPDARTVLVCRDSGGVIVGQAVRKWNNTKGWRLVEALEDK